MKKSVGQKKSKKVTSKHKVVSKDVSSIVENKQAHVSKRNQTIDILRAFAIVLMVLTHATAVIFNFEGGQLLQTLSLAGGTLCFTFFLILSGISSYLSFVKKEDPEEIHFKKHALFVRSVEIFGVYLLVASFSMFALKQGFFGHPSSEWLRDFLRIAGFQRFPEFTEFIIPLSGFVFISIFIKKFLEVSSKNLFITVTTSIIFYLLGAFLYKFEFDYERLNYVKGIFVGFKDLHLFPMFQYFGLFIFGVYIGRVIVSSSIRKVKYVNLGLIALLSGLIYAVSAFFTFSRGVNSDVIDSSVYTGRFPPSIPFLALGLCVFLVFMIIIDFVFRSQSKLIQPINDSALFISKNALSFFVLHIVLLLGAKVIIEDSMGRDFSTGNTLLIYLISIIILAFCALLILLKRYTVDAFFEWTTISLDLSILKVALYFLFVIAVIFGVNRELTAVRKNRVVVESNILGKTVSTGSIETWYDEEYVGRAEIFVDVDTVTNRDNLTYIQINHLDLIKSRNSSFDNGQDLRILKYSNNQFEELPIKVENPNTVDTKIYFEFTEESDTQYFLYFGSDFASEPSKLADNLNISFAEGSPIGPLDIKPFRIELNKNWFLKGFKNSVDFETLNYSFLAGAVEGSNINFEILSSSSEVINSGEISASELQNNSVTLDTSSLGVGEYYLQLNSISFENSVEVLNSKKYRFYVSYPLFVNWSIDWEGFGVNQTDLRSIADIGSTYNIPITHYFNPVIYIDDVLRPEEAAYYTNWVLNRANVNGDEIGLHNHLTPRLLEEVGVEKKAEAQIVGIGRDETALNGYEYEDLDKIIKWSIEQFSANGLGIPMGYRAGAWMVNSDLLRVLEDNGFSYDSSGRTGGYLTRSPGSSEIPWNLSETTKPYRPNSDDINSNNPPNLSLFEFPNNGADSYWFSLDELTNRFNLNYPQKTLESPQVVTYLSHPHGFEFYDSAKIRGLLTHIEKYRFDKNNGPVIQTTLENVYNNYNLTTFIE